MVIYDWLFLPVCQWLKRGLLGVGVGGSLVVLSFVLPVQGQSVSEEGPRQAAIEAIERVRVDADGDASPDRVGDTVAVAGRVSAQQGNFILSEFFFVQDETGGIAVHLPMDASIGRGDSIRVRGVLEHEYGLTQLDGLEYQIVDASLRSPSPLPLTVASAHGEEYEGQLGRIRGRVAQRDTNEGGEYLLLEDLDEGPSPRLSVFVPHRHTDQIPLGRFDPGDEIRVTGTIAQFDVSPPYTDYYQLWPRDPEDIERVGLVSAHVRTAIIVLIAAGLVAVLSVITLRVTVKRRTKELEESRARFRRLAEATFEGIVVHDEGKILDTNEALTRMVGYERETLVGQNLYDVLSDRSRGLVEDGVGVATGTPTEAVVVRADGTSFPVEIEEKTVELGGETMHVAALRDISERKKREADILLAKEEAEQMARLKSSLLNNMSHELRTPITSIIGYAELIMQESSGTASEFATRIRQSGKRLAETLQAVLEMAQLEAGALSPEASEVDVKKVAEEVAGSYNSMAERKGLALEVQVEEDCLLETDRKLLYRILSNLVHNAIKFTEEGFVSISAEPVSSGVQVTVRDTGTGIHEDYRPQLFEPFTQESKGRDREYEGIGLGLTVTKRMVELLGGDIAVESTKEKGSTFVVTLPAFVDDRSDLLLADGMQDSSS